MWLLTPEEIITASKETANMPEDWCRRQLAKIAEKFTDDCHSEMLARWRATAPESWQQLCDAAGLTSKSSGKTKIQ